MDGHLTLPPDLSMLPDGERRVVARALSKRPEDRWPDCTTFIAELAEGSGHRNPRLGLSPTLRGSRSSSPVPRPRRGRLLVALGLPALAALVLVVTMARPIGPSPSDPIPTAFVASDPGPPPLPRSEVAEPDLAVKPVEIASTDPESNRVEAQATLRTLVPAARRGYDRAIALVAKIREAWPEPVEDRRVEPPTLGVATVEIPAVAPTEVAKKVEESRKVAEPIAQPTGRLAPKPAAIPIPSTATIAVIMPIATAELAVRGEVGRGNPDEWYGPKRVIHTPPMTAKKDYLIGAFWLDKQGRPQTRSRECPIEPGRSYEVDLRPEVPTWKQIERDAP